MSHPTTSEHAINNVEEASLLPAGQWARDASGMAICLMETHMGFPQRMWGSKIDGGTKGHIVRYCSLDRAAYPLHLGDADTDACSHAKSNECGQCTVCGLPGATDASPLHFDKQGEDAFRMAAEHNALRTRPPMVGGDS